MTTRLTVGEFPPEMISVKREARAYRRTMEAAVRSAKGDVSIMDAHIIDAAVGQTIAVGTCRWVLRNRFDKMTVGDITACNREMRNAKRDRASIVKALDLDRDTSADLLNRLYSIPEDNASGLEDK